MQRLRLHRVLRDYPEYNQYDGPTLDGGVFSKNAKYTSLILDAGLYQPATGVTLRASGARRSCRRTTAAAPPNPLPDDSPVTVDDPVTEQRYDVAVLPAAHPQSKAGKYPRSWNGGLAIRN